MGGPGHTLTTPRSTLLSRMLPPCPKKSSALLSDTKSPFWSYGPDRYLSQHWKHCALHTGSLGNWRAPWHCHHSRHTSLALTREGASTQSRETDGLSLPTSGHIIPTATRKPAYLRKLHCRWWYTYKVILTRLAEDFSIEITWARRKGEETFKTL
jgi:hypothetical protein